MSTVKMKALRPFSSTVWGNNDEGEEFEVAEGYVAGLEADGLAERADKKARAKAVKDLEDAAKGGKGAKLEADGK